MVVGKHRLGLLVALLGDQPTWRLRDPPDEAKLDSRRKTLKNGDDPPRPVALDVGSSPTDEGNEEGTQIPETVVDGGEDWAMLRMANLGQKNGRAHLSEGVTETENETTSEVDLPCGGETRDEATSNHDSAARGDGNLTTKSLSVEWDDEKRDNGSNVVGVVHQTKAVVIGVVEVDFPARHLLGRVHHHTVSF